MGKGGKKKNNRVASPESVPIHINYSSVLQVYLLQILFSDVALKIKAFFIPYFLNHYISCTSVLTLKLQFGFYVE